MRCNNLEARDMGIPGREVLAVLGPDPRCRSVWTTKNNADADLPTGHVARFDSGIHQLIHRLHGEIEGHELDDWFQPSERGSDTEAGKSMLGNRRIDHSLYTELLQQPLGDLVGSLIFGDFFA